jgi:hypothetical protein
LNKAYATKFEISEEEIVQTNGLKLDKAYKNAKNEDVVVKDKRGHVIAPQRHFD